MSCQPCAPESTITNTAPAICPPAAVCAVTACVPSSYVCGDWTVTTAADCTVTRTRTSNNMPNGTYTNPTITVVNGCVSDIESGTNVLQSRPEPCSTASGTTPITPAPVVLSALPCNLASFDGGGSLFAGLTFNQVGQNIEITGCGTPTSPLVFNFTAGVGALSIASTTLSVGNTAGAYTVNAVGANANTCGYSIVSGIVKTWVPPIVTITAAAGITATTSACVTTLAFDHDSALLQNKTVVGVSCGNAFVDPATGALPALSSWQTGTVAAYGTRVHFITASPSTFFSEAGAVVGSSPGFSVYATEDAALTALHSIYTFAGSAAC